MHYQLDSLLALTCWSLLASVTVANPVAELAVPRYHPAPRRDVQLGRRHYPTKRSLVKRDANTTFDLGFEAKDVKLFDGSWSALGQNFSLSLACVECRTWGTLVASAAFPDDLEDLIGDLSDLNPLNDASLSVGFQGVGALVDLSLTTGAQGEFTIPLLPVAATPLGISGPGFQVGIVFGIDLVLGITGEVTTEGGFQVAIPDSSSFTIPLDPTVANTGKFDGASASLLPLTASAPANVTLALRLRVQAGLELPSSPLLEAKALAGAFINIPEITLGEQFTTSPEDGSNCLLPATADININAGVFVDVGADIGDLQLVDFNPTLSTTLFSAAASTCFITVGQNTATATTTATTTSTGTGAGSTGTGVAGCPVALTTETVATNTAFTITSCAAQIANCPASLAQVIVVSSPVTTTATRCPVSLNATSSAVVIPPYANTTTTTTTTTLAGGITLTSLTAPVTNTLTVDPTVTPPDVPSITGTANGGNGGAITSGALAVTTPEAQSTVYVTVTPTTCACLQ